MPILRTCNLLQGKRMKPGAVCLEFLPFLGSGMLGARHWPYSSTVSVWDACGLPGSSHHLVCLDGSYLVRRLPGAGIPMSSMRKALFQGLFLPQLVCQEMRPLRGGEVD